MNRNAYKLANEIKTELDATEGALTAPLSDMEMKRYKNTVLNEIKKEKRSKKTILRRASVAACAALALVAGTAAFGEDVHAAIQQIGWNIGSALGISKDLADYKEVVNTSAMDKGYMITLQEAVVSEEKLVVNYTLQREDGQSMEQSLIPSGTLYINGKNVTDAGRGSAGFLDDDQKILGVVEDYDITGIDLSQKNRFQLVFQQLGFENGVKGNWSFAFTADGTDLMTDTKRTKIEKTFELPDGVLVTLRELTMNDLEQRISYDILADTDYILMIKATDSSGREVEFNTLMQRERSGYMQNENILYDGRLDDTAKAVTMTLYAVELPEESGRMSDDYIQIGDTFELELR